jgi:hypothetical protein
MATNSQNFVPIKEIQGGVVLLKDGGMRSILMASSLNISLKSNDEQEAILMQFQNFLNTLDFPVQIMIQSRKRDIKPYLQVLEQKLKEQTEPLLKVQTREYIEFIGRFTELNNVMTKHFFVVVPFNPAHAAAAASGGLLDKLLPSKNSGKSDSKTFEEDRSQLEQRVSIVQDALGRTGVRSVQLSTDQVVELFYKQFNPGEGTQKAEL